MAKKIPLSNSSLSQLRENSRKASTGGPGSYANTDLAKQRNANFKNKIPLGYEDAAKARDVQQKLKTRASSGTSTFNSQSAIAKELKNGGARLKGQPGAAQGGSGKDGGNPCHDSEGKFC